MHFDSKSPILEPSHEKIDFKASLQKFERNLEEAIVWPFTTILSRPADLLHCKFESDSTANISAIISRSLVFSLDTYFKMKLSATTLLAAASAEPIM